MTHLMGGGHPCPWTFATAEEPMRFTPVYPFFEELHNMAQTSEEDSFYKGSRKKRS